VLMMAEHFVFFDNYFIIGQGDNSVLIIYEELTVAIQVQKSIIKGLNAGVYLISTQKLFANGRSNANVTSFWCNQTIRYYSPWILKPLFRKIKTIFFVFLVFRLILQVKNWDLRLDSTDDWSPPPPPTDYQNNTYKWMFYKSIGVTIIMPL